MSRIDGPARLAAYDVLVAVREDDAYANLVLPQLLRERRIEGRDAAFVTELVGGTLRGQGTYDAVDRPSRRSAHPTPTSATRSASAPTRCSPCGCPTTPRSRAPSSWCASGSGTSRPGSPTR